MHMNSIIDDKIYLLTNTPRNEELTSIEYKNIDNKTRVSDINLAKVRGSVRLSALKIILPKDIELAKKRVLRYSYK